MSGALLGLVCGLGSAALWGTGDFAARLSSDRVGSRAAAFYAQLLSLLALAAVLALWPGLRPAEVSAGALLRGAAVGAVNVAGLLCFYRAMEVGVVSLVSPIASSFAAISALMALLGGERPSGWQVWGMGLSLLGVVGVSVGTEAGSKARRGLGLAALASLLWGLSFYWLKFVVAELGPVVPVIEARAAAVVGLGAGAALGGRGGYGWRPAAGWIALCAAADTGAFLLYNVGLRVSLVSILAVLSSLFSAVTVLLSYVFLRERLVARQWAAVSVILAGVGLVSAG